MAVFILPHNHMRRSKIFDLCTPNLNRKLSHLDIPDILVSCACAWSIIDMASNIPLALLSLRAHVDVWIASHFYINLARCAMPWP